MVQSGCDHIPLDEVPPSCPASRMSDQLKWNLSAQALQCIVKQNLHQHFAPNN